MPENFSGVLQHYFPQHSVADHEVFLAFDSDDEAQEFTAWMHTIGWPIFEHHMSVKHD